MNDETKKNLERFLQYVQIDTQSDDASTSTPSASKELNLTKKLASELEELGIPHEIDEFGRLYGWMKGEEGWDPIGLNAHVDTALECSGANVKPRIIEKYDGGTIVLNETYSMSPKEFPTLGEHIGDDLVVTDGTTLLGADDKAGVAEIVTLCEELLAHPEIRHRPIAVCFTPDEEIGRGADRFRLERFPAAEAYTVDGGELGEIEYENFNAASAVLTVHGLNIHPGSAKGKMKNAALMAAEFIGLLPAAETPAHTEGYEGFYHLCESRGDESAAEAVFILRDHDRDKFEARKAFLRQTADYLNAKYGAETFTLQLRDSYYNMKEKLAGHMHLIRNAEAAMQKAGIPPKVVPIRGGTDGARLSYEGLPCPNLSTGGVNFHSIHEFIPVRSLEKMVEVLKNLVVL